MEALVIRAAFVVVEHVQVEIHLPGELRLEWADLEIECYEGLEEAVIKQKIDEILLAANLDAVLAADEAEAVAELEEECLQA